MAASLHRNIVVISVLAAVALRALCTEDSSRRERPQKQEREPSTRGAGEDSPRREWPQKQEHEPSTREAGKTPEEDASLHDEGDADCECREHLSRGSASKAKGAQRQKREKKGGDEKHSGKARGQEWNGKGEKTGDEKHSGKARGQEWNGKGEKAGDEKHSGKARGQEWNREEEKAGDEKHSGKARGQEWHGEEEKAGDEKHSGKARGQEWHGEEEKAGDEKYTGKARGQAWHGEKENAGDEKHSGKARGQEWNGEATQDDDRAFGNGRNATEDGNQTRDHDGDFHFPSTRSKAEEHTPRESKRRCNCTHAGEKSMNMAKDAKADMRVENGESSSTGKSGAFSKSKQSAQTGSRRCHDQNGDSKQGGRFLQGRDPNGDCEEEEGGLPVAFLVGVAGAGIAALCIWSGLVYVCCRRAKTPINPTAGVAANVTTAGVVVGHPVVCKVPVANTV